MSRSFCSAPALLLWLSACAAGGADTGSKTDAADASGSADGIIFKGPMAAGSSVVVQPLSGALEPVGEPVVVTVSDDGGSYSATIAHQGLVRITAEGEAFNEAWGDRKAGDTITLVAYGEVGERTSLHVNLLTHLIAPALEARLTAGEPFLDAQDDLLAELFDALPYEGRPTPGVEGPALEPFGTGYAQAWLFGFSAIVAEASRGYGAPDSDSADGFDLPAFLDALSLGFAAEGALPAGPLGVLAAAEPALNPDLAMLGLGRLVEQGGLALEVPDLHRFLDSDQDGVLNADDNCRYAPNPDQALSASGGHGEACDSRLTSISTTDRWGCGLLAAESAAGPAGGVVCWEVQGAETGGSPPLPNVFPAAQRSPWGAESPFAGTGDDAPRFSAVAVSGAEEAEPWVCATVIDGPTVCWDGEAPADLMTLPDPVDDLQLSPGRVCGLQPDGSVACATRGGDPAPGFNGPVLDFALAGDGHLCVLDAAGALACQDPAGAAVSVPTLAMPLRAIGGNTAAATPFICGVQASDGAISCALLDDAAPFTAWPPAPTGGGYADVAVGLGTICAWEAGGALRCGRFAEDAPEVVEGRAVACPEWSAPPAVATGVSLGACYACGVGADGFGACWPDDWSRARGEGEPIGG